MARLRCFVAVIGLVALTLTATVVSSASAGEYRSLPRTGDSFYWQIDQLVPGLAGLPAIVAAYPAPGSARIWDTDLFEDSNRSTAAALRTPTDRSPVVSALHAHGHYAVCYVEAGAFQNGFPDDSDFSKADYGGRSRLHQMVGWSGEWWLDIRGFRGYRSGRPRTLRGAAVNIAAGLAKRIHWCKLEGQDAVEADDIDSYTDRSASGAAGGGWGLTRADALGFERWLAYTAHHDGLAILQKNDPADAAVDVKLFDGALSEECNSGDDPCAGPGGDWNAYLRVHKPVLNAEYVEDGESTAKFCAADDRYGIWGALFSVSLDSPTTYKVCWGAGEALSSG